MKKFTIIFASLGSFASPVLANNAERFLEHDPYGWMMTVISMMVVFFALLILFICFKYGYVGTAKFAHLILINRFKGIKAKRAAAKAKEQMIIKDAETGVVVDDAELAAAIGMALFLNEDGMHDNESDVLTLIPHNSGWTGVSQNQKPLPRRAW